MPLFARASIQPDVKALDGVTPPKSMAFVRKAISRSVNNVLNKLRVLEKAYYGNESKGRILKEIKNNVSALQSAMKSLQISQIVSPTHVENVTKRMSEREAFSKTNFNLLKIKKSFTKVLDYVPTKFENIKSEMSEMLKYLEKYCVPFYDPESQPNLCTCNDYHMSIKNWSVNISHVLEVMTLLPALFKDGALHLGMFSANSKDLAIKAEAENLLFLVIFPEICENVRDAIHDISQWVKSDELYEGFLKNDIKDMEKDKWAKLDRIQKIQTRTHQIQYQVHHMASECRMVERELMNFQEKEVELLVEQEILTTELGDMKLDGDIKEFRLAELHRNSSVYHPDVLSETFAELTNDLARLAEEMPQKQKRFHTIQQKLDWSSAKRKHLENSESKMFELKRIVGNKEEHKQECEEEYATHCETLEMAKHIYLLKTCPDTVRKIFYNTLTSKMSMTENQKEAGAVSDMELACNVVAENIETDWVPLYFCLPFHPTRGINTIQSDIEYIKDQVRDSSSVHASKSLTKWRRFHTRSKLEDLKDALKKVRRYDVLALVESSLSPTDSNDDADIITYPSFMDEKLIPFYKEVEKFDQLRALGKI